MAAHRTRHFSRGFTLTETELRRIHEVMNARLAADGHTDILDHFLVHFQNEETREFSSLDEVVKLDNHGKYAIRRLTLRSGIDKYSFNDSIELEFSSRLGSGSSYDLKGLSDDNMHITASILDERLSRLFNWSPRPYLSLVVVLGGILWLYFRIFTPSNELSATVLAQLEQRWKNKDLTDPVEAILALERARQTEPIGMQLTAAPLPVLFLISMVSILFVTLVWIWTPYNFVWGDNIKRYEQRAKLRSFLIVTVVVSGLLLPAFRKWLGW